MKQSKRQQRLEAKREKGIVMLAQSKEIPQRDIKTNDKIVAALGDLLGTMGEITQSMHPQVREEALAFISTFHNTNIMNEEVQDETPWIEMKRLMLEAYSQTK